MPEQMGPGPEYVPHPIPVHWEVGIAQSEQYSGVVLTASSATGTAVHFLTPEVAEQVGMFLIENAKKAKAPRVIVPQADMSGVLKDLSKKNGHG